MTPNFDDERPTIPVPAECARCKGARTDAGGLGCWLCGGLGQVLDARVNQRWLEAGRPMTREEFHDV